MAVMKKHARGIALLILAAVTLYGILSLQASDWRQAAAHWESRWPVLCAVFALRLLDLAIDYWLWTWVLADFGLRLPRAKGILVYLSGYAGLLLPLQLGRFVRSDGVARCRAGAFQDAVSAEFAFLILALAGAVTVLTGVSCFALFPLAAPLAVILTIAALLLAVRPAWALLSKTPLRAPEGYWGRPKTALLVLLTSVGWFLNGIALYLMLRGLPGNIQWWQACLVAPGNLLAGALSGLPGGVGAVEGLLGVSLAWLQVPSNQLALVVGVFRLITFWIWVPLGWCALVAFNRFAGPRETGDLPAAEAQP